MDALTEAEVKRIAWLTFPDAHSIMVTYLGDEHAWVSIELGPDTNPFTRDYCYDPACETFNGAQGVVDAIMEESK